VLSVEVALPFVLGREGCRAAVRKERARVCCLCSAGLLLPCQRVGTGRTMFCMLFLLDRWTAMSLR
jgi:hypothetical protein